MNEKGFNGLILVELVKIANDVFINEIAPGTYTAAILFDWLSCILPWLFHFKSYASRQQRTVNTGNEFIKIVLHYFCFVVFQLKTSSLL